MVLLTCLAGPIQPLHVEGVIQQHALHGCPAHCCNLGAPLQPASGLKQPAPTASQALDGLSPELGHAHQWGRVQMLEQLSPVSLPSFLSTPRPQQAPSGHASCARIPPAPEPAMEALSPARQRSSTAKRGQKRKLDVSTASGGGCESYRAPTNILASAPGCFTLLGPTGAAQQQEVLRQRPGAEPTRAVVGCCCR